MGSFSDPALILPGTVGETEHKTESNKNTASGVAGLDVNSLVPETQLRKRLFTSGTDVYHSHDAETGIINTIYQKVKTITLTHLPNATLRIYFEIHSNTPGEGVFGKVYKNGVAVGTELNTNSQTYVSQTENIAGWSEGDALELYCKVVTGTTVNARNFRILYNGNAALVNS